MASTLQDFRADFPIADPNTGAITPEFLRFLFDTGVFSQEINGEVTDALTTANAAQASADSAQTEVDALELVVAGLEFDDLVDVDMTTTPPTNGQVPAWSSGQSLAPCYPKWRWWLCICRTSCVDS